jgi:hypothetical protein
LNLRQSGFCTLDRLNDAHHTGRRLQRLRQPVPKSSWLGSSTKLSYRPTDFYNENFQFMRFVMLQLIVTISLCNATTSAFFAYVLFCLSFSVIKNYSKVKYLNCQVYSSIFTVINEVEFKPVKWCAHKKYSKIFR